MKVEVFKCKETGKLFESEEDYKKHLEKQNAIKLKREKSLELHKNADSIKNNPRLTATSIEDFQNKMFDAVNILNGDNPDKLLLLEFDSLRFTNVSNTHSSPINGVCNWSKDRDKPTSYLGWCGNVKIIFSSYLNTGKNRDKIDQIINHFPGFNTGSGGSCSSKYGEYKNCDVLIYELMLYLDDFPLLLEKYKEFKYYSSEFEDHENKIESLINQQISDNSDINKLSNEIDSIDKLIQNLQLKRNDKYSEKFKLSTQIQNQIISENEFEYKTELDKLSEIFND